MNTRDSTVIAGAGLAVRTQASRWPARLDLVQSLSGPDRGVRASDSLACGRQVRRRRSPWSPACSCNLLFRALRCEQAIKDREIENCAAEAADERDDGGHEITRRDRRAEHEQLGEESWQRRQARE